MYLPRPLALASGCLKSLLFAAMSSDNLPSAITLASVDVGIRGAHLATYVGLSRAGLQLPVGLFLPPPAPITDTELALYATPVAAAVWSPSVDAIDALVKTWTKAASTIIPIHRAVFRRTVENMTRSYGRYTQPLRHAPPLLGLMTLQDDYSYTHNYSQSAIQHTPLHSPLSSPLSSPILLPINSPSGWPIHPTSSFADPFQSQPSLSTTGTTSAPPLSPTSATVVLGQCTPYRVLRSLGDTVLEIDLEDHPSQAMIDYKRILDELILDELEEPKEKTKVFVEYRPPPCTEDSCALVVYVEPSQVIYDYIIDGWVLLWCCHICIVVFFIVRACSMLYQMIRRVLRLLYSTLTYILELIRSMLEALVRIIMVICGWRFIPYPAEIQGGAPVVESPSLTRSLQLPVLASPAVHHNPNTTPIPIPAADGPHRVTGSKPGLKKKNEKRHKKKAKGTETREGDAPGPANIPLPRDDGEWGLVLDSNPVVQPTSVAPPLVLTLGAHDYPSTIDPATIPTSPDDMTSSPLPPTPMIDASPPTPIVDQTNIPPPEEDIGGRWETVVKRKPWRRVVPAPEAEPTIELKGVKGKKARRGKDTGKKKA